MCAPKLMRDGVRLSANVFLPSENVKCCERNARKRARQTRPSAPPLETLACHRWRRRFRLRIENISSFLASGISIHWRISETVY